MIVDASALVEFLLDRAGGPAARDAMVERPLLRAPHLVQTEVLHALHTAVMHEGVAAVRAESALDLFAGLRIVHHTHSPLTRRVWSLRQSFTAYDATYVALAEVLRAPLLTADGRLARAAEPLVDVILI